MTAPSGVSRAREAKDVGGHDAPTWDTGVALGNRRQSMNTALALVLALAVLLALCVAVVVDLAKNRYIPIPVTESGNGSLRFGADHVIADSVLIRPDDLTEFAKDFVGLRYEYDYHAGVAKVLAASQLVARGFTDGLFPSRDQVDRLDAQQTVVTLRYDSVNVRSFKNGIAEVALFGRKTLQNVQYSRDLGLRTTPFKEVVTIAVVEKTPVFRRGLVIRGAKGDLEP